MKASVKEVLAAIRDLKKKQYICERQDFDSDVWMLVGEYISTKRTGAILVANDNNSLKKKELYNDVDAIL